MKKKLYFFLSLMIITFVLIIYAIQYNLLKIHNSMYWPVTKGQIETIKRGIMDIEGGGVCYEYYEVKFNYVVNGFTYHLSRDVSENYGESIFIGSPIKVYYNPNNPNEAVLEPGFCMDERHNISLLVIIFIGIISIIIFKFGILKDSLHTTSEIANSPKNYCWNCNRIRENCQNGKCSECGNILTTIE